MVLEDPWHPIIDQPYAYSIRRVTYDVFGEDCGEPYLDLELQRDDVVRRLRFWSPQSLQLGSINRYSTCNMIIRDIRGRGWEGIGVEVASYDTDGEDTSFCAREVVDLDEDLGPTSA